MVPQRKILRTEHLDASTAHVERAILARANELEKKIADKLISGESVPAIDLVIANFLVTEFRNLAEEIHWW